MIDPTGPLISTGQGEYRKGHTPGPIDLRFWLLTLPGWLAFLFIVFRLGNYIERFVP